MLPGKLKLDGVLSIPYRIQSASLSYVCPMLSKCFGIILFAAAVPCLLQFRSSNYFWPGATLTLCAPITQVKWLHALGMSETYRGQMKKKEDSHLIGNCAYVLRISTLLAMMMLHSCACGIWSDNGWMDVLLWDKWFLLVATEYKSVCGSEFSEFFEMNLRNYCTPLT